LTTIITTEVEGRLFCV